MEHIKRLRTVIGMFIVSVLYIMVAGTDDISMSPVGLTFLLTAKLSFAVIVWYALRKTVNKDAKPMDWNKPIKEVTIYDVFTLLSFVVIVTGILFSYS